MGLLNSRSHNSNSHLGKREYHTTSISSICFGEDIEMFFRFVHFCLILSVFSMTFGNRCGWIVHRFRNYQQQCMSLLREMDVEDAENISIPGDWHTWHQWFINHRHSQPEKQIWFLIQMLEKISLLLSEGDSISWHQRQLEAFLAVLQQLTEGLRSCVTHRMRKNTTLSLYFQQLRDLTHNATGDKQNTWKWIRKQLLDLLALMSLFPAITVD